MNTSRIGAEYERAYRHKLEAAKYNVTRSAASKGPADLVAHYVNVCWHIQLKRGKMSCPAADRHGALLVKEYPLPTTCGWLVVHHTATDTFCEHVGKA